MITCFLTDNGSLRASSTLNLRKIAARLSERTGVSVEPVSLLHSHKVDPGELEGRPAKLLEPALREKLAAGSEKCVIVPLFIGPSRALTSYLPLRLKKIRAEFPQAKIGVAPSLFDPEEGSDFRLAEILRDSVLEARPDEDPFPVVVVDHGSPAPEVSYVRDMVAGQLSVLLAGKTSRLRAASMERRPGDAYRFSGPLLEEVLQQEGFNNGNVLLAMLFLSPGRHAGEEGDVWQICRNCERENPGLRVTMTRLLGEYPKLLEVLEDRLKQAVASAEKSG